MLKLARRSLAVAGAMIVVAAVPLTGAHAVGPGDWTTYLNNGARTGFNGAETVITPATVPNLTQAWTATAGEPVSAEAVQADGVVYYGSWDGFERAVDATTGTLIWKSPYLGQLISTACDPSTLGVVDTASVGTIMVNGVATQAVFVGGGNANLYALNASTGAVIWHTSIGVSTQPFRFLWSSPLLNSGNLYEGVASCGNGRAGGEVVEVNATTGAIQNTLPTTPRGCFGSSVWGSPTVDTATGDIYFATGNNAGQCTEPLSVALVKTNSSLKVLSSWQVPASQLPNKDSDFGTTPTLFSSTINGVLTQMVGLPNKNGIYYAFDRSAISSGPLWQKRISAGGASPETGRGDISPSAWNGRFLFIGGEIANISGVSCRGSIRALRPFNGSTAWVDCLQTGPVLGAVTAVPGVVFIATANTLYGVSASNGAILWSHQDATSGSTFWGALTISNGQVYAGNQDGELYAFRT